MISSGITKRQVLGFWTMSKPLKLGGTAYPRLSLNSEASQLSNLIRMLQRDEAADWIYIAQASVLPRSLRGLIWNKTVEKSDLSLNNPFLLCTLKLEQEQK